MAASNWRNWKAGCISALVWFHRWLGVATCLILAMWFASGAVLVFQPFPSLPKSAQFAAAPILDMNAIGISPAQAAAKTGSDSESVRLIQRADVPAYLVQSGAETVAIGARDGNVLPPIDAAIALASARAFLHRDAPTMHGPIEYDQWIVDNGYDAGRPYYRVAANDQAGTQIYISARTGEVAQRTTTSERGWNWVGAVLHWVYFTPLRASFSIWDTLVWSLSLLTTLVAVAGMTLGLIRTFAVRKAGRKQLTFFRLRWLKYHHILGLFIGVAVVGWAASGWLSMDHGRLFSLGQPSVTELSAYEGKPVSEAISQISPAALRRIGPAKEVRFAVVDGKASMVVSNSAGQMSRFDADGAPLSVASLDRRVRLAISKGWPDMRLTGAEDVAPTDFYAIAEAMPGAVRKYELQGSTTLFLYIDMTTGSIVTSMDESRVAYSWLYYGLHTLKVPGLINRPLLRQILILILLGAGFAFSLTGAIIGVQRLRKSIS